MHTRAFYNHTCTFITIHIVNLNTNALFMIVARIPFQFQLIVLFCSRFERQSGVSSSGGFRASSSLLDGDSRSKKCPSSTATAASSGRMKRRVGVPTDGEVATPSPASSQTSTSALLWAKIGRGDDEGG